MTIPSPFRGVAVAAVACAVGTPGVQRVGRSLLRCCAGTARVACHCRHPASSFQCSAVRCGPAVGRRRHLCGGRPEHLLRRVGAVLGLEAPRRLFCAAVLWASLWQRAAFPLSARQRLVCFGPSLPGSGPLHGLPCAAVGGTAWLSEHRNAPLRCAVGFRRHIPAAPLVVWALCRSSLPSFPCRGIRGLRFHPPRAGNPKRPRPRRLAVSSLQR